MRNYELEAGFQDVFQKLQNAKLTVNSLTETFERLKKSAEEIGYKITIDEDGMMWSTPEPKEDDKKTDLADEQ